MKKIPTITVGELMDKLKHFDKDTDVSFSGLEFNKIRWSGENLIQIQFVEQVYLNASGDVVVENLEK